MTDHWKPPGWRWDSDGFSGYPLLVRLDAERNQHRYWHISWVTQWIDSGSTLDIQDWFERRR